MIRAVCLLDEKRPREGVRVGAVRRVPRGVPKAHHVDYYDVWLPELAPSDDLLRWRRDNPSRSWGSFVRKYRSEMKRPPAQRLIGLLATLSHKQNLSVGCYCGDLDTCHLSVLCELLRDQGAMLA